MSRTPAAPVVPSVLRWARDDAGLSAAELGATVKADGDRVLAWEAGEAQPTLAQLRTVADVLRQPVAFFFTPEPPQRSTEQPPDFRAGDHTVSRQLRREIRRAAERRVLFQELAGDVESPWRTWRKDPPRTPEDVRARLSVGTADIARTKDAGAALNFWIRALEAHGVLVFQMSRIPVDECRGFAEDDDRTPCIVLNGADAPQARSFTLLHELAHLLDHSGALCLLDDDREVEHRCNRFAAAVLMPGDDVRAAVSETIEQERVEIVVRRFRVSAIAAALRLSELGLVSQAVVSATLRHAALLAKQAAQRSTRRGPAYHVLQRRNLGETYLRTVLNALDRDAITFVDATYYLDSTAATVEQMERSLVGGAG